MEFKMMGKAVAWMKTLLGVTSVPLNADSTATDFTAEQRKKLEDALGAGYTDKFIKGLDKGVAEAAENLELKAIQDELDALVLETNLSAEELATLANDGNDNGNVSLAKLKALGKELETVKAQMQVMMGAPEGDSPLEIIKGKHNMLKHSATHLFGTGAKYDAFEGRPWNARLRDGGVKATDFRNDSSIPTLQGDLEHFVRENPTVINSWFNDYEDLPAEWDRRSGVLDQVADAYIIPEEIVQGRKKGWNPKNKFKIGAEVGKVFAKKIDIEFNGQELQKLETTWLASIKNMDGSHPWKMSFIGFLLSELVKQQKVDDRKAQINGIYSISEDEDTAGAAVNSQNGLRYLWYYHGDVTKKYRKFSIGAPTDAGIVDYVHKLVDMVPEDERKNGGLELQLTDRWRKAYNKRAGEIYTLQYSTDQGKQDYGLESPIDRPWIKFQVLKDYTQTDFMGITFSKNIQIMDYDASEKGKFTITHEKRNTLIFADYRLGIRFIMVGTEVVEGDTAAFIKQKLWSNDCPVFADSVKVPIYDDRSGVLKINYNAMVVDEKWVTDIAVAKGEFAPGQVITITGNASMAGVKYVKDNSTFDLQGDFALNTGGTLTLYVNDDKTFKELYRTATAPVATSTDVNFNTATLDADLGSIFRYTGTASTAAFTGIVNGVERKNIRIYGKAANAALTLTSTGNIKLTANATLDAETDYIQLTKIAGVWTETKRVIT